MAGLDPLHDTYLDIKNRYNERAISFCRVRIRKLLRPQAQGDGGEVNAGGLW